MRVLCLARNYPNSVFPRLGLWTQRLVHCCVPQAEIKVVAPVPYWPPIPGPSSYTRFRRIAARESDGTVDVFHPRFVTGPGYWLHPVEGWPYYASVRQLVATLRPSFPFDLIHAHSIYPDGWAAARLARRYRVPLVITEHSSWKPWLDRHPLVRRHALWAADQSTCLIAVSRALADTMATFVETREKLRVIPNVVDNTLFCPSDHGVVDPNRLLFVGLMRHVKGLDVLLRAMRLLQDRGRHATLSVIGDSFYATYQRDYEDLRALTTALCLDHVVTFAGGQPPAAVAEAMRTSAVLVLPSRRETFGTVLAEALACGTPVVATRCGGTEDIVTDEVGVLVAPGDPAALAEAIARVVDRRSQYDAQALSGYARERFGADAIRNRLLEIYADAAPAAEGRTEIARSK